MKTFMFLLTVGSLALAACTSGDFKSTACSMTTVQSEELMDAVEDGRVVCLDDSWYVRLDPGRQYAFKDGEIRAVD